MKTRFITVTIFSLLTVALTAGDLDGYWSCDALNNQIEIIYTREGIKVRYVNTPGHDDWNYYTSYGGNAYRDRAGNCFTLRGANLEFCTADRRIINNFYRSGNYQDRNRTDRYGRNDDRNWDRSDNWRDNDWRTTDRDRRDRDGWNNYYRLYEGKWHNHSTGTHIHVDLSRRSLRIKFHGERWFEVTERNRGLFVDRRGNEFYFRGEGIEYRSSDGDLLMKFYNDDRCVHRDDYRSDYWR